MKAHRKMSRWILARRFHEVAMHIFMGEPVRVGRVSVLVPEEVIIEERVESEDGETKLAFEAHWPTPAGRPAKKTSPVSLRRRGSTRGH
jgi:hypothetical protein